MEKQLFNTILFSFLLYFFDHALYTALYNVQRINTAYLLHFDCSKLMLIKEVDNHFPHFCLQRNWIRWFYSFFCFYSYNLFSWTPNKQGNYRSWGCSAFYSIKVKPIDVAIIYMVWSSFFVKWHITIRGSFNDKSTQVEEL